MARVYCKIIINEGLMALMRSLEKILTDPDIHMGLIPDEKRRSMVDRMAKIDIASYGKGPMPEGGLGGILLELEDLGFITPDVWQIYARPEAPARE